MIRNQHIMQFLSILILGFFFSSCSHEKLPLPVIPAETPQTPSTEYVQLNYIFDNENGYEFQAPSDIYYGVDNFLYVADTDNDRIVMLDLGGAILGYSQTIDKPEAITQNDSLQLLIVNKSNRVYKIDLHAYSHDIGAAPVEEVWVEETYPNRQYTGISVHNKFEYYVTIVDFTYQPPKSFIYDFYGNHLPKGPLPLNENGTGLFSALLPTSIVSMRERYLDASSQETTPAFMFTQTGFWEPLNLFNYYKVQHIGTTIFEGQEVLSPNTGLVGTELYDYTTFFNPEDIAIDRNGNILVVDAGIPADSLDAIDQLPGFYRFGPTGFKLQSVNGSGSGDYQFNNPKGIAISPNREQQIVYIADTGNNRIVRYQLSTDF